MTPSPPTALRLASYNLHKCAGTDGRRDPGRVIDVLNALDADIIALQEVDRRFGQRPAALTRAMIEAQTDFATSNLPLNDVSLGWHGQTILVRGHAIEAVDRITLPGLEPRGAVLAEVALRSGQGIRIVGVHLGLLRASRQKQMLAIRAALARRPPMPTIILGDFNEWSALGGMAPLASGFTIHAPGRSFHATRPMAALDRVALGPLIGLADAGVIETPLTRVASDHLPIWADVIIPSGLSSISPARSPARAG